MIREHYCGHYLRSAALLVASASLCFGGHWKVARELQQSSGSDAVNVIVQYTHQPGENEHKRVSSLGGRHNGHLQSIAAEAVSLPASAVAALANDSSVAYISPDRPVHPMLDLSAAAVNAAVAQQQYSLDGTGIGVAVIDSGISPHADLGKHIAYSVTEVSGGTNDQFGHGTHVAGIIASSGVDSKGKFFTRTFRGIAPGVNLINIRVLDNNGQGSDSTVIAGIEQAIALKSKYNIRVMNLSLGRPVFESYTQDPLCQAVEAAWKAGIVVVVAAGNDGRDNSQGTNGYGTITAPGNDPYVITVGAMKTNGTPDRGDDTIASYSSKGPTLIDHIVKPDIVAPGNRVVSDLALGASLFKAWPKNAVPFSYYTQINIGLPTPVYFTMSGTSMATPVVSGAAALLLQQNPSLTPDQVKARLMKTAYKTFPASSTVVDPVTGAVYTDQYDIFTVGAGYLDIGAALANSDAGAGLALSPAIVPVPGNPGQYSLTYADAVLWGSSAPWASAILWGNTVLPGVAAAGSTQANAILWGTDSVPALAIIWGNAVVWGSSANNVAEDGGILIMGE